LTAIAEARLLQNLGPQRFGIEVEPKELEPARVLGWARL
jgi:hypothetical protein